MDSSRTFAAALGAAALVALPGCAVLAERQLDFTDTEAVKITEITIAPGSGDIVIRTGPVSAVRIKREVRYRGDEPGATYRIDGAVLAVETDCGRQCSVSYDILAPEGVSVRGENGSGDLELTDVSAIDVTVGSGDITVIRPSGAVTARTGSGDIRLVDAAGGVSARTGSGSIDAHGLGRSRVDAETGSGDITLGLTSPADVRAHASSGSIELTVPSAGYRVAVTTGSGSRNVDVTHEPAGAHLLELETGSGDVTVRRR
ncbi:Putative adhesin [Micromonospora pattaloongensis]|uniref:Adhesin n=1 Tax=Micromonospora pattaloongensis TaxID=405436 RepID=A0A1H3RL46_9ACTN|nr:DUF4097 family beta strand repeat-containing protein [Micromonospora pattaloongensis]SDZ25961.1 Putative adhesin [Micromonospora pattaloongensis]